MNSWKMACQTTFDKVFLFLTTNVNFRRNVLLVTFFGSNIQIRADVVE